MIGPIVERLQASCPCLTSVRGVVALSTLKPGSDRGSTPGAYVHPVSDRGGPSKLLNGTDQRVERRFGVLLSLTATDETRGGSAGPSLDAVIDEVREALVGWQPDGVTDPITFDSGALRLAENGVVWWLEVFATAEHLRRV